MNFIYEDKYLKYKNQVGGLNAVLLDALEINNGRGLILSCSTPEKFVIDVQIYDIIPPELTTSHFDKSLNYVALITFQNDNEKCDINWNIEPNIDWGLKVESGSEEDIKRKIFFEVNYKKNNKEKFITCAITKFKQTYPFFQPGKEWF